MLEDQLKRLTQIDYALSQLRGSGEIHRKFREHLEAERTEVAELIRELQHQRLLVMQAGRSENED